MQLSDNQLGDVVGRELLQPLLSIQLGTQVLSGKDKDLDSDTLKQIALLQQLSSRTIDLVQSLLILRTDETAHALQTVNLIEVVVDSIDDAGLNNLKSRLKIFSRPLKPLSVNRSHISQIIKILLSFNANDNQKPLEIRFQENGATQSVRIRDYGCQLTSQSWQRLSSHQFASMIQPLPQVESGFDLYLAMQLAKRLGGELLFEPKQKGNCYELRLPALYQPQIWQAARW
jgi:signal transduction histidine kinase